jgi:hypothetical protein
MLAPALRATESSPGEIDTARLTTVALSPSRTLR